MFSLFFKNDWEELDFCEGYKKKIFEFIKNNTKYNNTKIKKLIKTINNMGKRNDFLMKALQFYTSENEFVYFINRIMRQIDRGATKLSFLIGPMYYSLIRYVKRNPKFALQKDTILYRNIVTNLYNLNVFNMAKNKIICFPSFTSTSLVKKSFETTDTALEVNDLYGIKTARIFMILHYKHNSSNLPQSMNITEFSKNKKEKEVLFFPFTFVKVNSLKEVYDNSIDDIIYELDCNIIGRNNFIEFDLKKNKNVYLRDGIFICDL